MLNRYTLGPYCYLNDYSRQIILIHFQREKKKILHPHLNS